MGICPNLCGTKCNTGRIITKIERNAVLCRKCTDHKRNEYKRNRRDKRKRTDPSSPIHSCYSTSVNGSFSWLLYSEVRRQDLFLSDGLGHKMPNRLKQTPDRAAMYLFVECLIHSVETWLITAKNDIFPSDDAIDAGISPVTDAELLNRDVMIFFGWAVRSLISKKKGRLNCTKVTSQKKNALVNEIRLLENMRTVGLDNDDSSHVPTTIKMINRGRLHFLTERYHIFGVKFMQSMISMVTVKNLETLGNRCFHECYLVLKNDKMLYQTFHDCCIESVECGESDIMKRVYVELITKVFRAKYYGFEKSYYQKNHSRAVKTGVDSTTRGRLKAITAETVAKMGQEMMKKVDGLVSKFQK